MCLAQPHAGSDLGLARTRAVLHADGSYRLSGTKIFISGGAHDRTDNIVHLELARLPDAATGPKGLSLFLVPKILPDGSHAGAHCDRIEGKMGLHGSPTCGTELDILRHHADSLWRAQAQSWCALMTPVLKSMCSISLAMRHAAKLHVR